MRPLAPIRLIAGFIALAGVSSSSVIHLALGGPEMVTTRFIPSAGFQYYPPEGVEEVAETETQATRIVPMEPRPVGTTEERPAAQASAGKGGDSQAAVLCNRGLMRMQAGDYRAATIDFEAAMRVNPRHQRAHLLRGVVAAQQGNHAEAVGYYNRALQLGPGTREVHHSRGLALVKLQRHKEALDEFTKAIDLDPNFEEGYVKRGLLYGRMGEFEKSVEDNTKAISLDPTNPLSYHNRAAAYEALGKAAEASADLRKSQELEAQAKKK